MDDSVETNPPEAQHPSWCNRLVCSFYAEHGSGAHQSVQRRFKLDGGGTLVAYTEWMAGDPGPVLTLEQRGCASFDCDPYTVYSLEHGVAMRLAYIITSWLDPDATRAERARQWIDTGSGWGMQL